MSMQTNSRASASKLTREYRRSNRYQDYYSNEVHVLITNIDSRLVFVSKTVDRDFKKEIAEEQCTIVLTRQQLEALKDAIERTMEQDAKS